MMRATRLLMFGWLIVAAASALFADDAEASKLYEKGRKLYRDGSYYDAGKIFAEAEKRARALLGDGFEAALADPRIDAYLRKVEELFGRTSTSEKSGVPRLIRGQRWLVPETDDADELIELIRTEL